MTQYYILEIQQYPNGEYGHIVHFAYDENPDIARLKAESTYHSILAAASVSDTKKHSAIIISDEGFPVLNQCYKHPNVQYNPPAPEPEIESEVEQNEGE